MPLEDLVGDKYIEDLNASWPLGSDLPSFGDDHIRGIKNVLRKSFPNISGPVTRSHTDLNRGSVPSGSRAVFYQASAPDGWSRVVTNYDCLLRVVTSSDYGGYFGGSDDPVLMNKVPSHNHLYEDDTWYTTANHSHGASSANGGIHAHTGTANSAGAHYHAYERSDQLAGSQGLGNYTWTSALTSKNTNTAGAHTHSLSLVDGGNHNHTITVNNGGASHSHHVKGTTALNALSSDWEPRHINVILCTKI